MVVRLLMWKKLVSAVTVAKTLTFALAAGWTGWSRHVCVCVYVCVCVCVCVCMHACMHACMYACMHVYVCICMRNACIFVCTHIHIVRIGC